MKPEKQPQIALLLGYLIPGLGHFYLGKEKKGLFFMLILCFTFLLGFYLCDYNQVAIYEINLENHREFRPSFIAQAGIGLLAWAPALYHKMEVRISEDSPREVDPRFALGLLYMMVAGLLNILVAQNAFEVATDKKKDPKELPPQQKE